MRKPFLVFFTVIFALISAIIWFIQSPQFARVVKDVAAKYIPADLGVEGDFSEFAVQLFPPGVSIRNPKLRVLERNVVGLPAGSTVQAERIDLIFRPVQMFSGNIRVHEVTIVGGDVKLLLGKLAGAKKTQKKKFKLDLHWDQLFQVHAEAVSIKNTKLHIEAQDPEFSTDFVADSLRLGQWSGSSGLGYELNVALSQIQGSFLKDFGISGPIDRVSASAHVNAGGLNVDSIELTAQGIELVAKGSVKGNVLTPQGLALGGDVQVRGDLQKILQLSGQKKKGLPELNGMVLLKGKMLGTLDQLAETLRFEGDLSGDNMRFQDWRADQLKARFAWQAAPSGGELSVTNAAISSAEVARSGGNQPGSGGKVEVGSFKVDLSRLLAGTLSEPIRIPVLLTRAHVHWLAAPVVKEIYALDLRASGPVDLSISPARGAKKWEIEAKTSLKVDGFRLDNQRFGLNKPMHAIVAIPFVKLEANAHVDSEALRLSGVQLSTGKGTSFKGSGKIDFKTGYDLTFDGPVDLLDIGEISEIPIRGVGTLATRVVGPAASVLIDFNMNVKDAVYLNMALGELQGHVAWDDGTARVLFTQLRALKGRTPYEANGMVEISPEKDIIDLGIKIGEGEIQDLMQVFDALTKDLWWLPRELTGQTSGVVKVTGGVNMSKLIVDGDLKGTGWDYWGERFSSVQLKGGYDRGKYQITDFKGTKRSGSVTARISYDQDRVLDWGLHTQAFTLSDFDRFARLDVPMRGNFTLSSSGKGKSGAIKSSTQVQITGFAVRGVQMPSSFLSVKTEGGKAEIKGDALEGQGSLDAFYDFNLGGASKIRAELKRMDFSPALLLLNPRLMQDRELSGLASGSLDLSFRSGGIERANGNVEVSAYRLAKAGTSFALAHPVSFKVTDGSFDLRDLAIHGNQGEATLSLKSRGGELEGSIAGEVDLSLIEFVTSAVSKATGAADLDFSIGGALKAPAILGRVSVDGATLRIPALETPFEQITGALQLRQNVLSVQGLTGTLSGGRVAASGTVELFPDQFPKLDLKGEVDGSKLKVFPFQFVKIKGGIAVRGDKMPYLVTGDVAVDSALSREKVFGQRKGEGLKTLQYAPPPTGRRSGDYPLFKLDINTVAERNILIQNDLFDVEAKGRFRIVNTLEAPRILGNAELISGRLLFKDRSFQIQSASANFDNPTVINPSFNLSASTDVNGVKIQMYANGRLDKWKADLSSNPVMPESEILSLLALGVTSTEAKRFTSADRSVMEQGEAASLLLHSLDFNREMASKTGLQIQLDETVNQVQGNSIFKPQSSADNVAQPKIVIKRQIGNRFSLSYGTTVGGSGANNVTENEVNAEYRVSPGFSVMGVWGDGTIDAQKRSSMGLDLRFQTRFK